MFSGSSVSFFQNEIEFIQKRIDYGFAQFNTFPRLFIDNVVFRKQAQKQK